MRTHAKATAAAHAATTVPRRKPSHNTKRLTVAAAAAVALLAVCVGAALASASPTVSTGAATDVGDNSAVLGASQGLLVVDEAYGQFAAWSAIELVNEAVPLLVTTKV